MGEESLLTQPLQKRKVAASAETARFTDAFTRAGGCTSFAPSCPACALPFSGRQAAPQGRQKEVEMQRISKAVAAGLLCGLMLVGSGRGAVAAGAAPVEEGHRVDLNTASAAELARLPGIGPAKAQAIIEYRAQEPFSKPEDLIKVKGIGEKLYERLRDQITVGDQKPVSKGRGG